MTAIPGPAYHIVTQRLVLRCWNPSDAEAMQTAIRESLEHLKPWMPWAHSEAHETLQDKIERLRQFRDRGDDFIYGIFDPEETRVLGGCGLHRRIGPHALEIGYWLHVDYINRGLITEAAAALTRVAFEVEKVERVEIHCDPANVRSAAVPRKLGYTHDATLPRRILQLDTWRDAMIWSLFRDDFGSSPAASAAIAAYDAAGRRIL
ncbi:MAG: GNAT family N-acetyltransferase [Anaerolineales bacterium]